MPDLPKVKESEQVARAVAGDRDALDWLLLMHQDEIEAFFRRHLPPAIMSQVDVLDLVQETFQSACQEISGFVPEDDEAFARWLMTLARNRFTDQMRAFRTRKRGGGYQARVLHDRNRSMADLLSELVHHDRTPSRSAMRHEALSALEAAIDSLPEDHAQVIRLRRIEGLSAREVAKIMDRSETAVHTLCHRAMHALREAMGARSQHVS